MWAKLVELLLSKVVYRAVEQLAIILPKLIIDWAEKKKKEKEQNLAKEEYKKVKESDEANEDEIIKKHQDYINSGNRK